MITRVTICGKQSRACFQMSVSAGLPIYSISMVLKPGTLYACVQKNLAIYKKSIVSLVISLNASHVIVIRFAGVLEMANHKTHMQKKVTATSIEKHTQTRKGKF